MADTHSRVMIDLEMRLKSGLSDLDNLRTRLSTVNKEISEVQKNMARSANTMQFQQLRESISQTKGELSQAFQEFAKQNEIFQTSLDPKERSVAGGKADKAELQTELLRDKLKGLEMEAEALRSLQEPRKANLELLKQTRDEITKNIQATQKSVEGINVEIKAIDDVARANAKKAAEIAKAREREEELKTSQEGANAIAQRMGIQTYDLSKALKAFQLEVKNSTTVIDRFGNELQLTPELMDQLKRSSGRFRADLFTTMFMIMALQRTLQQFSRSAITTFQKANEDTEGLGKATWHLQAAWEFFKYSLIDALTNSPLFQMIVQWLVQLVQWFNKLSPTTKSIIAIALALVLISIPLVLIIMQLQILAATTKTSLLGALGKVMMPLLIIILLVGGIVAAIYGAILIFKNWGSDWNAVIKGIIILFLGLAAIAIAVGLAIGSAGAWATIGWIIGILAIVAIVAIAVVLIIKYWDQIKIFFFKMLMYLKIAWANTWAAIQLFFFKVVQGLINAYLWLYDKIAWVIDTAARGFITLFFGIQKGAQVAIKWVVDKFLWMAEKVIALLDKIPGLGGLVSGLRSGINSVKKGIDDWGDSLDKARDAALTAIDEHGAQSQIKKLQDLSDDYFDGQYKRITDTRDATINAAKDEFAAKEKAINDEIKAREEAAKKKEELEKEDKKTPTSVDKVGGLFGGGFPGMMDPLKGLDAMSTGDKEVNDNRTFNIDMDFNIEGGENLDEDKLYNQMMDKLGEGISRVTDVNNT